MYKTDIDKTNRYDEIVISILVQLENGQLQSRFGGGRVTHHAANKQPLNHLQRGQSTISKK